MRFSCAVLLLLLTGPAAGFAADPPNLIYILADDAGYGDFGCYGQQQLATPRVDQLAQQGMKFTRHYAGCTVCAPSRCVLLTGLHTGHCRVRGNSPGLLLDQDLTVAEILQQAGYETACIGKWGVGAPPPLDDPNRQGFDEFFGYISMWHAHNFYPEFLIHNGAEQQLGNVSQPQWQGQDGRGVAEVRKQYAPDLLTEAALDFIRRPRQQPFFLYLALNIPHANNEAGRHSQRPERGLEVPDFGPYADTDWPGPEKGFAAMMRNLDRDVGRILDELQAQGLDQQTLVLFSSDNGPHQEGGHQMEFFDSNGPLRGMKRDLYEGGLRVPLIARWPGKISAGTVSDHICGFQDVLPTFAEVAGVDIPPGLDGLSMLPTLLGQPSQQQHDFLYWEFSEQAGKRAVLQGDWKLIQQQVGTSQPAALELYDLSQDLGEQHNLAQQRPELVRQLSALLNNAHVPSDAYPLFPHEKSAN